MRAPQTEERTEHDPEETGSILTGLDWRLTLGAAGGGWDADPVSRCCSWLFSRDFSVGPIFKIKVSDQTRNTRPHVQDGGKYSWQ